MQQSKDLWVGLGTGGFLMLDIKCMFTHSPPHLFAGVDLFAFGASAQYMDLASLAAIPRYTCGEVRAVHLLKWAVHAKGDGR